MEKRLSASGIIVKDKKILLCKRSRSEKLYSGFWTVPGGKKDLGESFKDTAAREVEEEVGLNFVPSKKLGKFELITEEFHNISHVFLGDWSGIPIITSNEVEKVSWFSYPQIKNLNLAFSYRDVIEKLHLLNIL
jgi:8-oxo-dGTP diphosphatase